MAPTKALLLTLIGFYMGVSALAVPAPAPDPAPKDNKMITEPVDLGGKTGKIGVDIVDLSRLRVDPVKVEVNNRRERGDAPGSPVLGHDVMMPTPYLVGPGVEKRDVLRLVEMMARAEQEADEVGEKEEEVPVVN